MNKSELRPKSWLVVLTLAFIALGAIVLGGNRLQLVQGSEESSADYGARMMKFTKEGRYDAAVQVGLEALRNDSTDSGIYEQIAIVFLIRGRKDSARREVWADQAEKYIDKELSVDGDNPINLLAAGRNLEIAGDLLTQKHCSYYERALLLSERIPILLRAEHIKIRGREYPVDPKNGEFTAFGHTFKIGPLQKENQAFSVRTKRKMVDSGCPID